MPLYSELLNFYKIETVENYFNEDEIKYRIENLTIPKYNFIKKSEKTKNKYWLDLASGLGDMPYYLKNKVGM